MEFKNDDWSPHTTNYHRQLEQNKERNRRNRCDPEYRRVENEKRRGKRNEYMQVYRRNQRGPDQEIILHSEKWLIQEAADLAKYPRPPKPYNGSREHAAMNPEMWQLFCQRAKERHGN